MGIVPDGYVRPLLGPQFYVSPGGSDSTGTGTALNPWRTVGHAQGVIRSGGYLSGMAANVNIVMMPGDYWTGESGGGGKITFTDADAGSGAFNLVLTPQNGRGTVRILGGKRVTGWTLYSGSIYRAPVTGNFYTMYENGVRGIQARFPALVPDGSFPMGRAPYLNAAGVNNSQTVLQYTPGDLTPGTWDLNSVRLVDWSGGRGGGSPTGSRAWFTDDIPISSINTGTQQLTLSATTIYPVFANSVGSRYFCQGDLSMLVGPGQWYHDTVGGYLYYWPLNTPIGSQEIVVPTTVNVIEMIGATSTTRVHNVVVQDIEVEYSDYLQTWQVTDEAHQNVGLIYVTNANNVGVSRCALHASGTSGIYVQSYVQDSTIANNLIYSVGFCGIMSENYAGTSPDLGDVNTRNVISNNEIHNVGELVGSGAGIYLLCVSFHTLSNLQIYNGPRHGIEVIGSFGAAPTKNYTKNNLVQYSSLANLGQDSGDMGALYIGQTGDGGTPGINTFNQMTIDNTNANTSMTDFPPNGVFMDNNSNGQVFQNMNVTNSQDTAFRTNGSGTGTTTNVSWTGVFTGVDTWNIGLKNFPY